MSEHKNSQCDRCKHLLMFGCKAFEDIPEEILSNEVKHDRVKKGQKGKFIFTPKEKESSKK